MIEFCISGLAVISVTGLSCMHTWLIARMETTNEDVSYATRSPTTRRVYFASISLSPKKSPSKKYSTNVIYHVSLCVHCSL